MSGSDRGTKFLERSLLGSVTAEKECECTGDDFRLEVSGESRGMRVPETACVPMIVESSIDTWDEVRSNLRILR